MPGGKKQLKAGSFHLQNMKVNSQVKQPSISKGPKARKNKEPASLPSKAQWKSRSVARTMKRRDWGRHLQLLINITLIYVVFLVVFLSTIRHAEYQRYARNIRVKNAAPALFGA